MHIPPCTVQPEVCNLLHNDGKDFECHYVNNWGDTTHEDFQNEISKKGLEKYVFVFPTFYHGETFGLVLLEAMEYGLPCISTYEGGIPSIIQNNENGILVKQQSSEQLKEAMLSFIENPSQKDMGSKGREIYLKKYTIATFEKNITDILSQLSLN